MRGFAKEKNQEFQPTGNYNRFINKESHPHYAVVAYHINSLIDQDKHKEISINEFREIMETGNIIDYLESRFT